MGIPFFHNLYGSLDVHRLNSTILAERTIWRISFPGVPKYVPVRRKKIRNGNGNEILQCLAEGHQCFHNSNYWQFGDYLGIGAGAHSKLSFAHRIVRQVRFRDPARYMDMALAGTPLAQDFEIKRAELPFEYMLNALRLRGGFALQEFMERTGLPMSAIAKGLDEAQAKGLITRDLGRVVPTERGFDFLSDLQEMFL